MTIRWLAILIAVGTVGCAVDPGYDDVPADDDQAEDDDSDEAPGTPEIMGTVVLGGGARSVAISPDGATAYVALSAAGQVAVVSVDSMEEVDRWDVGAFPFGLALSADGSDLYVAEASAGSLAILDVEDGSVLSRVEGIADGRMVTAGPGLVWVARHYQSQVVGLDPQRLVSDPDHAIDIVVGSGSEPVQIGVRPDRQRAWVTNASEGTVTVFGPTTGETLDTLAAPTWPVGLTVDPAGERLLLASRDADVLSVWSAEDEAVLEEIGTCTKPVQVAVVPSGRYAYLTCTGAGLLRVIDLEQDAETVIDLHVGGQPFGIALTGDGAVAAVASMAEGTLTLIDTMGRD